jgi:hypothetical protein
VHGLKAYLDSSLLISHMAKGIVFDGEQGAEAV